MSVRQEQGGEGQRFSCPWCETSVVAIEDVESAVRFMEWHLDGHFLVGLPVTGAAAAPKLRVVDGGAAA